MVNKNQNMFVLIALALVIAFSLGMFPGTGQQAAVVTEPAEVTGAVVPASIVQQITSTTASLIAEDFYAPGASLDVEAAVLRSGTIIKDGDTEDANNDVTLNPGETVTIYFGDDGQTTGIDQSTVIGLDGSNDWYGPILVDQVAATSAGQLVPNLTIKVKVYKESAFSSWVTNTNGTLNSTTNIFNLAAGEEDCVELTLKAPSKAAYGNPYAAGKANFVAVIDANTTLYDKVWIAKGTNTSIPGQYISTADWAFELPENAIANTEKYTISVCAKTTGSLASTGCNETLGQCDINIAILDPTSYYDEEGRGLVWGIEDEEDNVDIGYAQAFSDIVLYTTSTR